MASVAELYQRHCTNPRRERALLSAVGFTTAFATARAVSDRHRQPHAGVGVAADLHPYGVAAALTLNEFAAA
jgi:hypothetical protein